MPVRKARLFTAVSLDGCLLDEMDWLPDTRGQSFLFDTHVWEKLEPGLDANGQITVLSPRPVRHSTGVQFDTRDAAECLRALKDQEGKTIWICAGPKTIHKLMKADLIDEYELVVVPEIRGSQVRLFKAGIPSMPLTLKRVSESDGLVCLSYERLR